MALESESMEESVRTTIQIKLGCSMPINAKHLGFAYVGKRGTRGQVHHSCVAVEEG